MTHLCEEDLILLYYDEPAAPAKARIHLAECVSCRRAAEALAETLDACNQWAPPAHDPERARSVWADLAPRLQSPRQWWPRARVLIAVAAAALLVVAAFVAGRASSRQPARTLTAGLSLEARQRILAISLADHFDRAEVLLTELSNASDTDAQGFATEREQASDLVNEGRLIRQILANEDTPATLPLLDEVERFMLEVANAPDPTGSAEIADLKSRIGANSLLFKVRIIESNLRTPGHAL